MRTIERTSQFKRGVTQTHISEWEIGRWSIRVEQALELAKALKTTVGYLVGESETRDAA